MTIMQAASAAIGVFFLTACFVPVTALSQDRVPCGERTKVLAHLYDGYAEIPTARGLDAQGRVLEVISAPSGTWTIVITAPGGLTCLISSGVAWEDKFLVDPIADPGA